MFSSGVASPGTGQMKHIHFNEQVEQYIALDMKGGHDEDAYSVHGDYESDSDDGAIMMKGSNWGRKARPNKILDSKASFNAPKSMIARIESTTLKYRNGDSQSLDAAGENGFWRTRKLSPSPSQETSRPSKPSTRTLLGYDDENDDDPGGSYGAISPTAKIT
jgi:hypothetical protein